MWWAAETSVFRQVIQDRWRAACLYLNHQPTQMAIPLQME